MEWLQRLQELLHESGRQEVGPWIRGVVAATEDGSAGEAPLETQSTEKTKTVWIVKTKRVTGYDGDSEISAGTDTYTYTYNSSGLVSKLKESDSFGDYIVKYSYKDGTIKKVTKNESVEKYTVENGRIAKGTIKRNLPSSETIKSTYTYKSGNVSKCVSKDTSSNGTVTWTSSYARDKAGRVTKRTRKETSAVGKVVSKYTWSFKYDAQGNLKKVKVCGSSETCKNTYDAKGRLFKRVRKDGNFTWTETYTYKKITVKASLYSKVSAQQWEIVNGWSPLSYQTSYNTNFSFGGYDFSGYSVA